jgi:DNA-binding CsgD family transcriptional regulator
MQASGLVGRTSELTALGRALDQLELGGGGVVLLEGEPGIGKTRLLEAALDQASARKLETLQGSCGELQHELPFAPLVDALDLNDAQEDPERTAVLKLLRGGRPEAESEHERRIRVLHALGALVERACERGGTVLAVEDLQWADQATLLVLERLGRRLAHLPLLLLLTLRPFPMEAPLQALLASLRSLAEHLVVGPLDEREVRQLVEASLGAAPGDELLRAVRGAAGNPLFISEVLATLEQEEALVVVDGVVDAAGVEIVHSLRLAILRRLGFLPRGCLDVLRVASLLGSEFDLSELSTLTGTPAPDLVSVLGDAIESNVVHEAGPRLAFRHDLVREVLYKDRPLAMRQALHYEAARKLGAAGYPAMKVAPHLLRGATDADDETIATLRAAARECVLQDPVIATQLLDRTAALMPTDHPVAVDVKAQLAQALIWAGKWTDAERLSRELMHAGQRPDVSGEVLEALVESAALRGSVPAPIVREVEAAAHAADLDPALRARLLTAAAQAVFLHGDLRRTRRVADEALNVTRQAGDEVRQCEALMLQSAVAWHEGRAADGLAAAEQAVALARGVSPHLGGDAQLPFVLLAMNLALLQRYEEALAAFREGMEQAERANNIWVLGQLHQALGVSQFFAGGLDAAEGEFEAALTLWEEAEARPWAVVQQAWLGRIAVHRGDVAGARRQLVAADAEVPPGSDWTPAKNVPVISLTRALVSEAGGDLPAAFSALEDARRAIRDSGAAYFNLRIGPELVRFALAVGERDPATEMTLATEAVADVVGTPAARGQALRCRGLLAGEADVLREAVAAHRDGPSRVELAGAAEEAAGALAATGASRDAIGLLHEALEVWEAAGAFRDAGRVLARMRALGARPGKRGPRRRAETGWDSLTDSERRVLERVREGLTYREIGERLFISRRTVETHISRIFWKLGVSSRAELAALLMEQSSTDLGSEDANP